MPWLTSSSNFVTHHLQDIVRTVTVAAGLLLSSCRMGTCTSTNWGLLGCLHTGGCCFTAADCALLQLRLCCLSGSILQHQQHTELSAVPWQCPRQADTTPDTAENGALGHQHQHPLKHPNSCAVSPPRSAVLRHAHLQRPQHQQQALAAHSSLSSFAHHTAQLLMHMPARGVQDRAHAGSMGPSHCSRHFPLELSWRIVWECANQQADNLVTSV